MKRALWGTARDMPPSVTTTASDVAGRTLSALTGGIARLRPADKPLHPVGTCYAGRLLRTGSDPSTGVPWLDLPGEEEVLLRTSHAIGLPGSMPDFDGLAVRVRTGQGRYADLLLATTGWDRVTRHVLVPSVRRNQPLTTLLPYRSPTGPIVIGARPLDDRRYELHWARVGHAWHPLGEITVERDLPDEADVSFDPVLNPLPGLQQYPWIEHLRERSYATARHLRGEPTTGGGL